MMKRDLCVAAVMTTSPVGELDANLAGVARWAARAARQGAEMVCFPELNLTGYTTREGILAPLAQPIPGPLTHGLRAIARENRITLLAGLAERGDAGELFASHVLMTPQGACQVYRKIHLASPEKDLFTPGEGIFVFQAGDIRVGLQLCYDAHFPEMSTAMALDGADLIFVAHASPRGTPEDKLTSWMRHLPARAFDNGLFVVAVNQVGDNGRGLNFPGVALALGPDGKLLGRTTSPSEEMLVVKLKYARLRKLRGHPLAYFLPHRRQDLY